MLRLEYRSHMQVFNPPLFPRGQIISSLLSDRLTLKFEIDGTTTLVLSHRGVMVCIEPVCDILSGAFDAADAGTA